MVQRWNVCAIVFWRVVWYRAGTFLCMRSWPCCARRGRRGRRALDVVAVAVASRLSRRGRGVRRVLDVAVAWLWCGCGVVICVAVVWLRHADECQCLQWFWRGLC